MGFKEKKNGVGAFYGNTLVISVGIPGTLSKTLFPIEIIWLGMNGNGLCQPASNFKFAIVLNRHLLVWYDCFDLCIQRIHPFLMSFFPIKIFRY